MKIIFLILFMLVVTLSFCQRVYYFSSSTGNDKNNGSLTSPYKTISKLNSLLLKPGDTVKFKKNDLFVGSHTIKYSGSIGKSIVYTTYSDGNAPIFLYNISGNLNKTIAQRCIIYATAGIHHITIDGIKFTDTTLNSLNIHTKTTANVGYAIDFDGSSSNGCNNIVLKNLHISLVGNAIEIHGNNDSVINCFISDLGGIKNNKNDQGNYGGNAITMGGCSNCMINNTIKNCWRTDQTFDYDGGAFEIYGAVGGRCSNNTFNYNIIENCQGVFEVGSDNSTDSFSNNIFSNNILTNNGGRMGTIHNGGDGFSMRVSNLQFTNNTIDETLVPVFGVKSKMFWFSKTPDSKTIVCTDNSFNIQNGSTINITCK